MLYKNALLHGVDFKKAHCGTLWPDRFACRDKESAILPARYDNSLPAGGRYCRSTAPQRPLRGDRSPTEADSGLPSVRLLCACGAPEYARIMAGCSGGALALAALDGLLTPLYPATLRMNIQRDFSLSSYLPPAAGGGYASVAAPQRVVRFDSLNEIADNRTSVMRYFYVRSKPSYAQIMVGRDGEALAPAGFGFASLSTLLRLTTPNDSGLVRYGIPETENANMTTSNTPAIFLPAPETDGMFTATDITLTDLLDQCRALVFAITELTNTTARDCLIWVLMERLEIMREIAHE